MRTSKVFKRPQAGFTLIELIIVIVIIGILAAVAIPKLTGVSDQAHKASNKAILGMVRSAYSAAYAANKGTVTLASLLAVTDPVCTGSGTSISCPTSWTAATPPGTSLAITIATLDSPSSYSCTTPADCD